MVLRKIRVVFLFVAAQLAVGHISVTFASENLVNDHGHHSHDASDPHMHAMETLRVALKAKLGADYDRPVSAATAEQLATGKQKFEQFCVTCHGVAGKGDGAAASGLNPVPADFTDPLHASFYSDRGRLDIIKSGSPGTAMMGWSDTLNDAEILAVFQVVRSFRDNAATPLQKPTPPQKQKHGHAHDHQH